MSSSSSGANDEPGPDSSYGDEGVSPWVVRLFLILSFGVAFGIEGMTLIRSYVLEGEEETEQQAEYEKTDADEGEEREAESLRTGDDLLPATTVSERVVQMRMRAQTGGPWVFRLVVRIVNEGEGTYRLAVRNLETDDGTVLDEVHSVECPPGDSTRLVATWPMGADARPHSLTAEAELRLSADSTRSASRRVSFGHVPVRMER